MPKLTMPKLKMPKLARWDLITCAAALAGVLLMGAQVALSGSGLTPLFIAGQLAVCLGCLMLLGKTATEGTLWGNLAAVAGMFIGMGGILLAAALWASA